MLQAFLATTANRGRIAIYRIEIHGGTVEQRHSVAQLVADKSRSLRSPARVCWGTDTYELYDIRAVHALELLRYAENACCDLRVAEMKISQEA